MSVGVWCGSEKLLRLLEWLRRWWNGVAFDVGVADWSSVDL